MHRQQWPSVSFNGTEQEASQSVFIAQVKGWFGWRTLDWWFDKENALETISKHRGDSPAQQVRKKLLAEPIRSTEYYD